MIVRSFTPRSRSPSCRHLLSFHLAQVTKMCASIVTSLIGTKRPENHPVSTTFRRCTTVPCTTAQAPFRSFRWLCRYGVAARYHAAVQGTNILLVSSFEQYAHAIALSKDPGRPTDTPEHWQGTRQHRPSRFERKVQVHRRPHETSKAIDVKSSIDLTDARDASTLLTIRSRRGRP